MVSPTQSITTEISAINDKALEVYGQAVGAGFHPHLTGRENIYLNGTILGMTRRVLDVSVQ